MGGLGGGGLWPPSRADLPPGAGPVATSGEGFVFVDGDGPVVGDGNLRTYRLEGAPGDRERVLDAVAQIRDYADRALIPEGDAEDEDAGPAGEPEQMVS